jgi:hypothetical protein
MGGLLGISSEVVASTPRALTGFLDRHCLECHDSDVQKGGLNLQGLAFELGEANAFKKWQQVFERVQAGEMPPKKQDQPEPAEAAAFLTALKSPLLQADQEDLAANGRVRSRRLTRTEYEHTLHDLLGIDIPLKVLLPEDAAAHGFETVAEGQQLSHHQLAAYLNAADLALDEAFTRVSKGDATYQQHHTPEMLTKNPRGNYRGPDLRDGKSIAWPMTLQFAGRTPTQVPESGWYRITLRGVEAINPTVDGAVWGTLRSGECESNAPMLFMIGLVEATSQPRDLVYEAWIYQRHRLELRPNDGTLKNPPSGANGGNVSFKGRNLAAEGYSGIAHRGIDIERIYPNANRNEVAKRLFGQGGLKAVTAEAVPKLVSRFANRAFRRPVPPEQAAPYHQIAKQALTDGASSVEALRAAYRAILCSPRFLTFVEAPGELDDYALASRLSYALWCSLPDWPLLKLASEGQLKNTEVLGQQVERLLLDARAERFINSFTDQWLKLNQIDFTTPDPKRFRSFDTVLLQSMLQETRQYVAEMVRGDLGITHLVDSDFAFLNGRLLRHYASAPAAVPVVAKGKNKDKNSPPPPEPARERIELVAQPLKPGAGLQKVALLPNAPRGGLVTQGAILKVTADGSSTSPVVRGVFINERILGNHIPAPPPGVPAIEPDIRGATSIRDQLEKHRESEACTSCHLMIDPPGFALENFDPVGVWRTGYGLGGKGAPVDPTGITPEGDAFADIHAWQQLYTQRADKLARGFATQFLTYATGAPLRFSNAEALEKLVQTTASGDYGTRSLIRQAILSELFRMK